LLGLAAVGLGCSRPAARIKCYPVKGRVFYKGKPLADVMVLFYPQERSSSPSASGVTDEEGLFTLSTYDTDDGAPAGRYDVGIGRESGAFRRQKGGLRKGKSADPDPLQGRFENPRKSKLSAQVEEKNNNELEFNLR